MRLAVVLTVAIIANCLGNLFLSQGMKQYGRSPDLGGGWLLETAHHVVTNGWLIAGVVLLIIFLSAYLTALSWADLSFVLPATAPAYLLTAGLSSVFLHEKVSFTRWVGTLLIVTGTWLVSRTAASSAPALAAAETAAPGAALSAESSS
jgi:uncharacterized membrane protein